MNDLKFQNSPDEVCSGDDHDATHSGDNQKDTVIVTSEVRYLYLKRYV